MQYINLAFGTKTNKIFFSTVKIKMIQRFEYDFIIFNSLPNDDDVYLRTE